MGRPDPVAVLLAAALLAGGAVAQEAPPEFLSAWVDAERRTVTFQGRVATGGAASAQVLVSLYQRDRMVQAVGATLDPADGTIEGRLGPMAQALATGEWELRCHVRAAGTRPREAARYALHVGDPAQGASAQAAERDRLAGWLDFLRSKEEELQAAFAAARERPAAGEEFEARSRALLPMLQDLVRACRGSRAGPTSPIYPEVHDAVEQLAFKLGDLAEGMVGALRSAPADPTHLDSLTAEIDVNLRRSRELLTLEVEASPRGLYLLARRIVALRESLERTTKGLLAQDRFDPETWKGFSWQWKQSLEHEVASIARFEGSGPARTHDGLVERVRAIGSDLELRWAVDERSLAKKHRILLEIEFLSPELRRAAGTADEAELERRLEEGLAWLRRAAVSEREPLREELLANARGLRQSAGELAQALAAHRANSQSYHGRPYPPDVRESFTGRFRGEIEPTLTRIRGTRRELTTDVYFPEAGRLVGEVAGVQRLLGGYLCDEFAGVPEKAKGGHGEMHDFDREDAIARSSAQAEELLRRLEEALASDF